MNTGTWNDWSVPKYAENRIFSGAKGATAKEYLQNVMAAGRKIFRPIIRGEGWDCTHPCRMVSVAAAHAEITDREWAEKKEKSAAAEAWLRGAEERKAKAEAVAREEAKREWKRQERLRREAAQKEAQWEAHYRAKRMVMTFTPANMRPWGDLEEQEVENLPKWHAIRPTEDDICRILSGELGRLQIAGLPANKLAIGDRLWVQEPFRVDHGGRTSTITYMADNGARKVPGIAHNYWARFYSRELQRAESMPDWACRIVLTVKSIQAMGMCDPVVEFKIHEVLKSPPPATSQIQ